MTNEKNRYNIFLDRAARSIDAPQLVVPENADRETVARLLEQIFAEHSDLDAVALVVDGSMIGNSTRLRVLGSPSRGLGDAERASLGTQSRGYKVLRFSCAVCSEEAFTYQTNRDELRACSKGHGPMDLSR